MPLAPGRVYLYSLGTRRHVQDPRPGRRADATLCGLAGHTEDQVLRVTPARDREKVRARLHARPLCKNCERQAGWWL